MSPYEFKGVLEEAGLTVRYGPQSNSDIRDELDIARTLDECMTDRYSQPIALD